MQAIGNGWLSGWCVAFLKGSNAIFSKPLSDLKPMLNIHNAFNSSRILAEGTHIGVVDRTIEKASWNVFARFCNSILTPRCNLLRTIDTLRGDALVINPDPWCVSSLYVSFFGNIWETLKMFWMCSWRIDIPSTNRVRLWGTEHFAFRIVNSALHGSTDSCG